MAPRKKREGAEQLPKGEKRAKSAYFLWSDEFRAKHQGVDDGIKGQSMSVVSKVLSENWKLVSAEEKLDWDAKAAIEKAKFAAAHAVIDASLGLPSGWSKKIDQSTHAVYYLNNVTRTAQWNIPEMTSSTKMPDKPKSAAWFYAQDVKTGVYADLSDEDKAKYEAMTDAAKAKYKTELKALRDS